MHTTDTSRPRSRTTTAAAECCSDVDCRSGLRNHYYESKRLTPDMFKVEHHYLNERRRLLNRAIHGWGVVYGYALKVTHGNDARRELESVRLSVGTGLALDTCGRELLQTGLHDLRIDDLIVLDDKNQLAELSDVLPPPASSTDKHRQNPGDRDHHKPVCALLSVHYAEQDMVRLRIPDACQCEHDEWDRICETVRYSLQIIDCDTCCGECDCELHCACGTGGCCHEADTRAPMPEPADAMTYEAVQEPVRDPAHDAGDDATKDARHDCPPFKRGGCRCLCDHLTDLDPGDECCGGLCDIDDPCGHVRVDLKHGVPLACIQLVGDHCGDWTLGELEPCGPRRLVKRNDLLFDLIRGCDLTRIESIGWAPWHRREHPVAYDHFSTWFGPVGYEQEEYITRFWVKFTKPVRRSTLRPDCFAMTVFYNEREGEGGWVQMQRVPIVRLDYFPHHDGDPAHTVRGAALVIAGPWVEDALRGAAGVFFNDTSVEIEVRGDFILDCNGQPVDANAVGPSVLHGTGNGTPGGTLLSPIPVGKRKSHRHRAGSAERV